MSEERLDRIEKEIEDLASKEDVKELAEEVRELNATMNQARGIGKFVTALFALAGLIIAGMSLR